MEVAAWSDARIQTVLGRLEMILDNENSRIGTDPAFDLKASNARKSRCLYELTMMHRTAAPANLSPAFESQTKHIHAKLEMNVQKVNAHMEACRSVVDLLKAAVQEADADGIYSEQQFRYGDV